MEPDIGRQILAEIRHPAGQAEIQHVAADDLFREPDGGGGVGEIDQTALELAESSR